MSENENKETLNPEQEVETAEETVETTEGTMEDAEGNAEPADTTEDAASGEEESKGFFKGKKKKEDKKEQQYKEQIAELNDRVMRQMAEFDNFRKRTEREKSAMFEIGAKDIVERILPVIDNFERGLNTVSEEERESSFVQGIEMIYKQLMTVLGDAGVKPIEAVGKEFDPNYHNAVMHAEDDTFGENIVAEEFQKGYMYRDSVVRHSMVKVVN